MSFAAMDVLCQHGAGIRNFTGSLLQDADFGDRAVLRGADFSGSILTNAVLTGAVLADAIFVDSTLSSARMGGANLYRADLSCADARRVNLCWSFLRGTILRWADLTDADFTAADLTDADFTGATLTRARGFRFPDARDPESLRAWLADWLAAVPGRLDHATGRLFDLKDHTTPRSVASWACYGGGVTAAKSATSAATRLLWLDGAPMPPMLTSAYGQNRLVLAPILEALR